jgi:hypothetical protein
MDPSVKNPVRDAPEAQMVRVPFRVVDAIRAHHAGGRRAIVVPEWRSPDGTPVTVHFGRLTSGDLSRATAEAEQDLFLRNLKLLIAKAEDAEGKPLFASGDLHVLREQADYAVLARVIAFLLEEVLAPVKAEALLTTDPT